MSVKEWLGCFVLGAVMLATIGCGGSQPAAQGDAAADQAAANQTAAGQQEIVPLLPPAIERLPGQWQGQMVVDEAGVKSLSPENVEALRKMQMGIAFAADGKMVLSGDNNGVPYSSEGKWELIKDEGEQLTLKSIEATGEQKDIVLMFEGADVFYMPLKTEVANLGAMRFERMR